MLIRRLTQHIKEQNWFAVSLDFIIVVMGIFIGLQVTDWNNQLANKQIETVYLKRLEQDLILTVANFTADEKRQQFALKEIATLIQRLKLGEQVSDPIDNYAKHLSSLAASPQFEFVTTTMEELRDTGGMLLIRSTELRGKLGDYHKNIQMNNRYIAMRDSLRQTVIPKALLYAENFSFTLKEPIRFTDKKQIFKDDYISNLELFLIVLEIAVRNSQTLQQQNKLLLDAV